MRTIRRRAGPADHGGTTHAPNASRGDRAARRSDAAPDRRADRREGAPAVGPRADDRHQPARDQPAASGPHRSWTASLAVVAARPSDPSLHHRPGMGGPDHRLARRGRPAKRASSVSTWLVAADRAAGAASDRQGNARGSRWLTESATNSVWARRARRERCVRLRALGLAAGMRGCVGGAGRALTCRLQSWTAAAGAARRLAAVHDVSRRSPASR